MKRKAQSMLSEEGQLGLDQYRQVLQHLEDLSIVTVRNYLSGLSQLMAWHEKCWYGGQEDCFFRLAQIMGYHSLDTTMHSAQGVKQDLQQPLEKVAWI